MKSIPLAVIGTLLSTSAALAHSGPHDDIEGVSAALSHALGSPDHASWLILGVTAVLMIVAVKAAVRIAAPEKSDENP